jgi:hypothetical protein
MHLRIAISSIKEINRFFLKLLLIEIIIFACDRGIGTFLKIFYFHQESGTGFRTTFSIDSTSADILVFGSSRANHSYVPEIFEKKLSATFYNTGKDGNFVLYNYAIFKVITKRYYPDLVIIDISPEELAYNSVEYERLSSLLPYYKAHPEIRQIVDLRGPFEKTKHISSIYPYNSLIMLIAMGNLQYNKLRKPDNKGYVPLYKTMINEKHDTLKIIAGTLDENKIVAIKDIISTCKQNNIDLVFVYSPTWNISQISFYNDKLSELFSSEGIRFLDLSNPPAFMNKSNLFADINHLNDDGAKVFSNMVTDSILAITRH